VEEIILHRDNIVTEGATSNVFMIKAGILFTHPASKNILSGEINHFSIVDNGDRRIPNSCQLHFSQRATDRRLKTILSNRDFNVN
jgi:hypothetical protein